MPTFARHRIRIKADPSNAQGLLNEYSGATPHIYRARAVQFDIGIFYDNVLVDDISNLTSVTAEVKALNADGSIDTDSAPLASKTLSAASLDPTLDAATWQSKAKQHAAIPFTSVETALSMSGAVLNKLNLGLIITALTTDGERLTLCVGIIQLEEDGGVTSADTPTPGDPQYLTSAETVALVESRVPVQGTPGGFIVLQNAAGQKVLIKVKDDAPELEWYQI